MKTAIKKITISLLSILFISGCEKFKNSDASNPLNYFEYNGNKYSISQAFMENYGEIKKNVYNLDFYLLSNTLEIVEKNNLIDHVKGTGNGLYFEAFTSTYNKFDTAIYSYESYFYGTLNTFNQGNVYIDYDSINKTGTRLKITDGFFKVEKNDPEYEVIIECTVSNGKKINGYYKGTAKVYDYVTFYGQ